MKRFKTISIALSMLALVAVFTGCDPSRPNSSEDPTVIVPVTGTKTIQLFVTPSSIPADGVSASQIVALCRVGGQLATNGLPVTFKTDKGDFSINGVEPVKSDEQTRIFNGSTVDGQSGIYLLSDDSEGTATVTATFANDVFGSANIEFSKIVKDVATMEIKASPASGNSPLNTIIEVVLKDEDSKLVDGVQVRFRIDDPGARFSSQNVKSDINGKAQTNLSNVTRDAIVTATAQGKTAQIPIGITNDVITTFALTALNLPTGFTNFAFINPGYNLLLQAKATGSGGGLVNQSVNFTSTDGGVNFTRNPVKTDNEGVAETWAQNNTRDALLTASAGGKTATLSVKINRAPYAEIIKISGEPLAGGVVTFVLSGINSFDPDEGYGDAIQTYVWRYEWDGTAPIVATQTTSPPQITLVVGVDAGVMPADGDELRVYLQVEDKLGLRYSAQYTITFTS